MNITDLFCTPEQGKRLKELVTTIEPAMWWVDFGNGWEDRPYFRDEFVVPYSFQYTPALTLQELRDVAKHIRIRTTNDYWVYTQKVFNSTAPELAAWVIERLEDTP